MGSLITVSDPEFSAVHNSFVRNREILRREGEYPVIFGLVDGLNEPFQFKRDQPTYVVFNVELGGFRGKNNVFYSSEIANPCLSKKFCFFWNLINSNIFQIDFLNSDDFLEIEIHHRSCGLCTNSYFASKKSELKNLILEIPTSGPPIIDFK